MLKHIHNPARLVLPSVKCTHTNNIHALHYITLHDMTLHYITLHYILQCFITWFFVTLDEICLHKIAIHVNLLWNYTTLHYMFYMKLHCIAEHFIAWTYITVSFKFIAQLHYVTLHCITLNYIILPEITVHQINEITLHYAINQSVHTHIYRYTHTLLLFYSLCRHEHAQITHNHVELYKYKMNLWPNQVYYTYLTLYYTTQYYTNMTIKCYTNIPCYTIHIWLWTIAE